MGALSALGQIQAERVAAFPAKVAENPFRALALSAIQRRNAALDALFYDVKVVTSDETPDLAFWLAREGAVLFVPPSGAGRAQVYLSAKEFLHEAGAVAALAVAGVGSSALGAAAFARNVADALQAPVAAVVSGYGLADVLTEALGGFFFFGGLNSIRHMFEPLDSITKRFSTTEETLELSDGEVWARTSEDTQTVVALLEDERFAANLLVGHSKGNLVISEALYAITAEKKALATALADRIQIVTISAKIGMPPPFREVLDVMGEWDWFGALNSRPDIASDFKVPCAWHSTNPDFPLGLGIDVTATLKEVLPMFAAKHAEKAEPKPAQIFDMPQIMTTALREAQSAPALQTAG